MRMIKIFGQAHVAEPHYWMEIPEDMVVQELCKRHAVTAVHLNAGYTRELLDYPIGDVLELLDAYKNDTEVAGCVKFYKRIDY